jgi:DNA-binding NtrC family response regulator
MEIDSILIADPDPALLHNFSLFISSDLPGVELRMSTSAQQTVEQLSRSTYSTLIAASRLIQGETPVILNQKRKRHALVPLILTAGREDREPARDALLHRGAFDVITKPVDPTDALASIQVALWQARFLTLLTQQEPVVFQLQRHLATYPGAMGWISERVHDTQMLVQEHMQTVGNTVDHQLTILLVDLAGSVEEWILEQAMNRLERIRMDHVWM